MSDRSGHSVRMRTGIRLRLLGPIALFVVAMLLFAAYGYARLDQEIAQDARLESSGLARQAAREYGASLTRAAELLAALSKLPEIQRVDVPACQSVLASMVQELSSYANLGVVDRDGLLLCSALGTPRIRLADREWFQRAVTRGQLAVGDFQIGKLTHRATVNVALPVRGADGEIAYVLYAAITVEPLGRMISELLPEGSTMTVIDPDGRVLSRAPESSGWIGRDVSAKPLIQQALGTPEGTARMDGLDGSRRLYAWTRLRRPADGAATVLVGLSEEGLVYARRVVVGRTMAALAGTGFVLLGLVWLISSHTFVRRIRQLVHYSRTLEGGDLEATSGVRGHDELAELARAMEELARSSRDALRAREDFLSAATHELRTPITTLTLHASQLVRQMPEDAPFARRARLVQNSAARLARLVDSLLELSRVSAHRFDVQRAPTDLAKLVRRTVERYSDLAESAGCELRVSVPESLEGEWDATRLDLAFGNLLSNAIKYGRARPIQVTLGAEDGTILFTVTDEGVGIPPEQLEAVFERFERASTAEGKPGFGFGLYLARQIVEAQGGTIRVVSEIGRGSTFEIRLPR